MFEMMRGGALIDHIESLKTFTEKEAAIVVKCVTSALQHLHGQGNDTIFICPTFQVYFFYYLKWFKLYIK